jgi:hypothetical protein
MVRLATVEDIPAMLPLMRVCHGESVYAAIPFNDADAERLTRGLIESDEGAVFTNGTAFLAVALTPLHFNFSIKQVLEVGFYGPGGGDLVDAAKAWGREQGAARFIIANEKTKRHEARTRWLRMRGLMPCAVTFEEWL